VGELKHVLMRSRDPFTSWMAAYYTAQVYKAEGNVARALAYVRRASELADACGETRAVAASANEHGTLALVDSRFAEARACFEQALRLSEATDLDAMGRAIIRDNLGYCLMCTGEVDTGIELCRDAAATLEGVGSAQYLAEVYQDLCYGHLQRGEFGAARAFGEKALEYARRFELPTIERNTLMLLADAAMDEGDEESTEAYLDRLAAYYPDFHGMKNFLRAFNVREVINLKA
jgi:tetratricopeptide (TPR) repeat protein